jgi:hypothetical protein
MARGMLRVSVSAATGCPEAVTVDERGLRVTSMVARKPIVGGSCSHATTDKAARGAIKASRVARRRTVNIQALLELPCRQRGTATSTDGHRGFL